MSMYDWLCSQHGRIDVRTTTVGDVRSNLEDLREVLPCLEPKRLKKRIRKKRVNNESKVMDAIDRAVEEDDYYIMDIGIYGAQAVGCQITDERGESLVFVLSRRAQDIEQAREYFHRICPAERFHPAEGSPAEGSPKVA